MIIIIYYVTYLTYLFLGMTTVLLLSLAIKCPYLKIDVE